MNKVQSSLVAKIGPSILNADLANLADECNKLLKNGADYLHLDVMDGHFVPNLTFGHPVVKCLRSAIGQKPFFDLHMMVAQPEQWVNPMAESGADQYTFHYEATSAPFDLIRKIREADMKVGVGIKPNTPVEVLVPLIDSVDMVLIMTVEPGFGGQSFMLDMMSKVKYLRQNYPALNIEVDGGVGTKTIDHCAVAGANWIVSGTGIINSDDQSAVIKLLRDTVNASINNSTL